MEHASGWRHGGGPAAGLAASRHPRRHRQQLHRCSGGLRQRAAPCLAGVPLQAQMLAAWRRPPRGVPVRPKCLGVIHSGRPFQARDAYDGCSRVRRPSGEPGLRVVARVDLCIAREKDDFPSRFREAFRTFRNSVPRLSVRNGDGTAVTNPSVSYKTYGQLQNPRHSGKGVRACRKCLVRRGRIWEQEDDRLWLWCGRHDRR